MYNVQIFFFFHLRGGLFSTNIVAIFSKLGTTGSFDVASLGLFEVDYIPDRSEILLTDYVSFHINRNQDKLTSALTFLY